MPETHKKTLLVVDDDAMLLDVLEGILADLRDEWDMEFFKSGEEALEALARSPVDLVLADIHLAGMGGIHLLSDVKDKYPHTIRIACSGCAHPNTIVQSLEVAHQYLPKPLTLATLKRRSHGPTNCKAAWPTPPYSNSCQISKLCRAFRRSTRNSTPPCNLRMRPLTRLR